MMGIGIHTIVLLPGVESENFEQFMIKEVFPRTAELRGSVNRGGVSAIRSQHLLKSEVDDRIMYWWLIKDSGALNSRSTGDIINSMYDIVRDKLEAFGTRESSSTYVVIDSLDIGPRDSTGRPLGSPKSGSDI